MPKIFRYEEVTDEPFLFISYSHKDKPLTEMMATTLLENGVRLWYDEDLAYGDEWEQRVRHLITHPNCHGVIFMCSPDSYLSPAVHTERSLALETQQVRGEDNYQLFLVNVCDDPISGSYMNLLKATFARLSADLIDKHFPIKAMHTLISIIGRDSIASKTCDENWVFDLLEKGIRCRAKETIDKGAVILDNMQSAAHFGNISLPFGTLQVGEETLPLKWQLIDREQSDGLFLLEAPLPAMNGGDNLSKWLNGEFRKKVFSPEQDAKIIGNIRLLTLKEAKKIPATAMKTGNRWWLADRQGGKQAWVDAEGCVSERNYSIASRFSFDVRPTITLTMQDAEQLFQQ
ncbi:MAG: toll/interleukin-1 receptor domain-containing protein [Oscillospiraceae bacterium]|nr:toll/interleukin-1 receptor domain-containing protein [Oscillospiraceae bacterium]